MGGSGLNRPTESHLCQGIQMRRCVFAKHLFEIQLFCIPFSDIFVGTNQKHASSLLLLLSFAAEGSRHSSDSMTTFFSNRHDVRYLSVPCFKDMYRNCSDKCCLINVMAGTIGRAVSTFCLGLLAFLPVSGL